MLLAAIEVDWPPPLTVALLTLVKVVGAVNVSEPPSPVVKMRGLTLNVPPLELGTPTMVTDAVCAPGCTSFPAVFST